MNRATLLLLASTALTASMPASLVASNCAQNDPASPGLSVALESNRVSIEARDVPLFYLLQEIGKLAGFETRQLLHSAGCLPVTVSVDRQPLTDTVLLLLGKSNRIVFFSEPPVQGLQGRISQVWLLAAGSQAMQQDHSTSKNSILFSQDLEQGDAKSRSEAVLRLSHSMAGASEQDQVLLLARLAQILQQDQDALVRARAAIALGALADYRSIIDLEMALGDEQESVRVQSINALGQIGGERVSVILGAILLNQAINPSERVVAAQALWKLDSETARGFLRMAVGDEVEQVSQASSRAPESIEDILLQAPAGPGVSE